MEQAIRSLSEADWVRLRMVSERYARSAISAEDLLQETLLRAWDGSRRCPTNVDVVKFLAEAMRSIADEARKKEQRKREAMAKAEAPVADGGLDSAEHDAEQKVIEDDQARRIRISILALFDDDQDARALVEAMMEEFSAEELRELTGLDKTAYDTTRRRIRRRLGKAYPDGWKP